MKTYNLVTILIIFRSRIELVIILKGSLKKTALSAAMGVVVGVINGMFGAGGGMITVPTLKKMGLSQRAAHANAVAVILPITVISAIMYLIKGYVGIKASLVFIPTGLIGSFLGTLIIKKISPVWLKRIFGGFMIYAGARLLMK